MKKKIVVEPLKENGLETIRAIVALDDRWATNKVVLDDGDEISIMGHHAEGVMMIYEKLNFGNKKKMSEMTLLKLLHIYTEAVGDKILRPPGVKTTKGEWRWGEK